MKTQDQKIEFPDSNPFHKDITTTYPHSYEIVESISDDLMHILSHVPNSFIYGGLMRDIVAGMKLEGDIDIITTNSEQICRDLNKSCRWIRKNTYGYDDGSNFMDKYGNIAKKAFDINYYINTYGYEAQIIRYISNLSKPNINPLHGRLLDEVRSRLDLRCCGIVMTGQGRVIEILEGAEKDCLDRVLHINKDCKQEMVLDALKARVEKLQKRGWSVGKDIENYIIEKENDKGQEKEKPEKEDFKRLFISRLTLILRRESDLGTELNIALRKMDGGVDDIANGIIYTLNRLSTISSEWQNNPKPCLGVTVTCADCNMNVDMRIDKKSVETFDTTKVVHMLLNKLIHDFRKYKEICNHGHTVN